jgi:threonine/homoserine/homoserine lactone efflux protein
VSSALLRGLLIGVVVAAPVGPMALLAIRRTLDRGFRSGFASGLGIASADGLYAGVAAFGLTAVSGLLLTHARLVQLAGGALIVLLGVRALRAPAATRPAEAPSPTGLASAYVSCLALTLANPPTILSFIALFAGVGVVTSGRPAAVALVAGVFIGSAGWWLVLTGGVVAARSRLDLTWRVRLTRTAALAMMLLGAAVAFAALCP